MKKILFLLGLTIFLLMPNKSYAATAEISSARFLTAVPNYSQDNRTRALKLYLEKNNSPLADHASTFVEAADQYNLDWKLVAAISGLESSFGQKIPYNSYNGWGWGVYGTNVIRFNSWDEAIETISKGLRENYLRDMQESDPYFIGPTYAASPTWAQRVSYFMNSIQAFEVANAKDSLSISI